MMGVVVGGMDIMQILGAVSSLLLSDSDSDKKNCAESETYTKSKLFA